jgi:hypothetical protein
MLGFSESDPDFVVDPSRVEQFESETSDSAFETRIADLIRRAHEHDLALDSSAGTLYQEARDSLRRGDHYLSVMVDRALGPGPGRGAVRTLAKSALFLILIPITLFATLLTVALAVALAGALPSRHPHSGGETLGLAGGFVALAGIVWYLVRLMIRESRS